MFCHSCGSRNPGGWLAGCNRNPGNTRRAAREGPERAPEDASSRRLVKRSFSWIPASAGMTGCCTGASFVIPAGLPPNVFVGGQRGRSRGNGGEEGEDDRLRILLATSSLDSCWSLSSKAFIGGGNDRVGGHAAHVRHSRESGNRRQRAGRAAREGPESVPEDASPRRLVETPRRVLQQRASSSGRPPHRHGQEVYPTCAE